MPFSPLSVSSELGESVPQAQSSRANQIVRGMRSSLIQSFASQPDAMKQAVAAIPTKTARFISSSTPSGRRSPGFWRVPRGKATGSRSAATRPRRCGEARTRGTGTDPGLAGPGRFEPPGGVSQPRVPRAQRRPPHALTAAAPLRPRPPRRPEATARRRGRHLRFAPARWPASLASSGSPGSSGRTAPWSTSCLRPASL